MGIHLRTSTDLFILHPTRYDRDFARQIALSADRFAYAEGKAQVESTGVEGVTDRRSSDVGGGGGSRTRARKCYCSRAYMRRPVPAPGIPLERSRPPLRTDKKPKPLV